MKKGNSIFKLKNLLQPNGSHMDMQLQTQVAILYWFFWVYYALLVQMNWASWFLKNNNIYQGSKVSFLQSN